ncbi:MAG: hypothetical protein ACRDTG_05915 [Pseudonocardiaceae bacterium]
MSDRGEPWKLDQFSERLDVWIEVCDPSPRLRRVVRTWVLTRFDNPYEGVRQAPGFDNLWSGKVPNSEDGIGNAVLCAYFIETATHTLRCDQFATLREPFL